MQSQNTIIGTKQKGEKKNPIKIQKPMKFSLAILLCVRGPQPREAKSPFIFLNDPLGGRDQHLTEDTPCVMMTSSEFGHGIR